MKTLGRMGGIMKGCKTGWGQEEWLLSLKNRELVGRSLCCDRGNTERGVDAFSSQNCPYLEHCSHWAHHLTFLNSFLSVKWGLWYLLWNVLIMNMCVCVCVCVCVLSCSVMSDSATPWTIACQALLSMGFSRQECWSGLLFSTPGNLPNPGMNPCFLHWQAESLPLAPPEHVLLHR